ncbi:MAG: hypothetical protein HYY61_06335 [Deltaproteobacteria bacterium]|nr:hypothetical protein [Deltaproteobacteria bacterium]
MKKIILIVLGVILNISILDTVRVYAQAKDSNDFFDDFRPEDVRITSGGTLFILSGATLDVQSGATFTQSSMLINNASDTAVQVQDGSGNNVFAIDTNGDDTVTVTSPTNNTLAFVVEQADLSNVLTVDTLNSDVNIANAAGTNVLSIDTSGTTATLTTTTNNASGFVVDQSDGTDVLTVNTSTGSVSIRNELTLGAGGMPLIDIASGSSLRIFAPGAGAKTNTVILRGNISVSGDFFNPTLFELQSNMATLEKDVSTTNQQVTHKMNVLSALEKQVNQVNKEIGVIKETSNFSPEAVAVAKSLAEKNIGSKSIHRLVEGPASNADGLHTHKTFAEDVTFNQDVFVKGERASVKQLLAWPGLSMDKPLSNSIPGF